MVHFLDSRRTAFCLFCANYGIPGGKVLHFHTRGHNCILMSLYAGPLPKTLVDFWRLVWQERPPSIVMITNLEEGGKIKCQRYWPWTGRCSFGPFEVTLTDEQMFADYTTRTLEAQVSNCYSMLFCFFTCKFLLSCS